MAVGASSLVAQQSAAEEKPSSDPPPVTRGGMLKISSWRKRLFRRRGLFVLSMVAREFGCLAQKRDKSDVVMFLTARILPV